MAKPSYRKLINELLRSDEPSIRYKTRVNVLGENPRSRKVQALRKEVKSSPRVQRLLAARTADGRLKPLTSVYQKWAGAHWVLATLADIGYPTGDRSLIPIRNQVYDRWLDPESIRERVYTDNPPKTRGEGVPVIEGRARVCAAKQANTLYATLALGLADDRADQLAALLMFWQWPDGGWNCDIRSEAHCSSFFETHIPLRALAMHAHSTGRMKSRKAAKLASGVFLRRKLFRRVRDNEVMNEQFLRLHYPCYWHYDILFGLKAMAEAGFIRDRRCSEALDMLQSKHLRSGGWAAEEKFYHLGESTETNRELVDWGGVNRKRMNPWVTVDALYVLRAAGRF
jgi:hypothetical protein